jgi:hypothetical protein
MSQRTREEHLEWCKARAEFYWSQGELINAVASMASDLEKHPEMGPVPPSMVLLGGLMATNHDREGVKRWIDGWR